MPLIVYNVPSVVGACNSDVLQVHIYKMEMELKCEQNDVIDKLCFCCHSYGGYM